MYYVINWTDGDAAVIAGITTDLKVGSQNVPGTATSSAPAIINLTSNEAASAAGQDFTLVLNGTIAAESGITLEDNEPIDLKYTIKIYVTQDL